MKPKRFREDDEVKFLRNKASGTPIASKLSKEAQERRRKYLLDYNSKEFYLKRSINGDQYV